MIALQLDAPAPVETAPLQARDVPPPEPAAAEVLIQVRACGVCHTDLHVAEGELPARRRPLILGHQVVGRVVRAGPAAAGWQPGDRVGVPWLNWACGECAFCRRGEENLCPRARFTGWDADGGYAEYLTVDARFAVPLPAAFADVEAAPLLCAGIIGYRSLRRAEVQPGEHIGLFGFGASAHLALLVARQWGGAVSVFTRGAAHRALAEALGAAWAGPADQAPPGPLDRAVIFAPAGELVPAALARLRPGGTLAINAIHMSAIPSFDYRRLYGERTVRSVANATRQDAAEFLALAGPAGLRVAAEAYPLTEANRVLLALKRRELRGAAVLLP
ncbi:MAG: zinc-dependent alcohol dehydrogenase family protein [Anaerolineales bacterium]|nr:zinc-dependent alcohol dehydrogenase family protein [Anaerolineales bacterium]